MNKLGFGDNKTVAPTDPAGHIAFLAKLMSAAINNEVDLDAARVALTASTRIIEVIQADTRMKAVAIATRSQLSGEGWKLIDENRPALSAPSK